MIWALLALIGVPVWLIVIALAGALASRRRFRSQPGVFLLFLRPHDTTDWPRRPSYGRYIRDVLIVNRGIALMRTSIHTVVQADPLDVGEAPKGLVDPVAWTLRLEAGEVVDIAVSGSDSRHLARSSPSSSRPSAVSNPDATT